MANTVKSFSIKPDDYEGAEYLRTLENYASRTGISFSKLIIEGMALEIKELNIDVNGRKQN